MNNELEIKKEDSQILSLAAKKELCRQLEKFNDCLSKAPLKSELKTKMNAEYLPISFVETTLDEVFFGLWEISDFKYQCVANELIGSLQLRVFHPTAQTWITRTGCASSQIRMAQGSEITDISKKIKNGLEMDMPRLKTACIKNAAKSLGKTFGRDLNRKSIDEPKRFFHKPASKLDQGV